MCIRDRKYTYTVFMDLNDMIRDFQVLAGKQLDYAAIADSEKKIFVSVGDKKWEKQAVVAAASDQMNTLEAVAGGTGFVKTSVSYTHLDVYKRQRGMRWELWTERKRWS